MEDENRITEVKTSKEEQESESLIKIAILGKDLVGKTALISKFINDKIPITRETTVEDQYKKVIRINNIECELKILDTAGQEEYQSMMDDWIDFASCFLLVYSIDNNDSFIQIKQKYDYIIKKKLKEKKKYSIIIVGNKCDLENERKVSKEEVESYGKNIGVMTIETSALNGINVNEAFLKVIEIHLDKIGKKDGKGKGCPCF